MSISEAAPPDIKPEEIKDIVRMTPPRAAIVYETIRREGEEELNRPAAALAWSALAAGLSMGFSFVAEALFSKYTPDAEWTNLVTKFGYCIGFLIVILGRQQLFTENTITPILQVLSGFGKKTLLQLGRLWGIVLSANLLGAIIFAAILYYSAVFDDKTKLVFLELGQDMMATSASGHFFSAIFAGWLVALLVWTIPFADTAKVSMIIIITYIIGLGGFSHVIAGTTEAVFVAFAGEASIWEVFAQFFLPTLTGNIIGGTTLVALINHAQVFTGSYQDEPVRPR